jgi:acyl-CoA reductase-like NAD-dependent aldehyde dehydrogenase
MWHEERLLIDGELVPAEGGRTYKTLNPSTGEPLGDAADATLGDADRAIAAARKAFDTTDWSRDRELRVRCLRQLHTALIDQKEDMRALLVAEVGAPLMLTDGPQMAVPVSMIEYYADLLEGYEFRTELGVRETMGMQSNRFIEKEAAGVIAAIIPYNYPLQITLAKLVPALAAGCTVIVKSPPETPWVCAALGQLIAEKTDIPAGVVNVLTGQGGDTGQALVEDPRVDMVSFTGSTATGRKIMRTASDTIKKVFLELGGKSAFIVVDDADLDIAAMFSGFMACSHAGQGCAICTRLLVPESKHDELVEKVAATMSGMAVGNPVDAANMMGPLISEAQLEKVEGYVIRAVDAGAKVATGGHRLETEEKGYFYAPTLLTNVDQDSAIAQEEIFGPVLVVIPYKDDDDAVAIANNSIFGLSGGVFGTDLERATNIARRLRTGTVSVNGGMYYGPDAPFGGYKQSGIGREMGVAGMEEYLEMKTLATPAG